MTIKDLNNLLDRYPEGNELIIYGIDSNGVERYLLEVDPFTEFRKGNLVILQLKGKVEGTKFEWPS